MSVHRQCLILIVLFFSIFQHSIAQSSSFLVDREDGSVGINAEGAEFIAQLAIDCVHKEYPNKLNQQLKDASQLRSPKELHPAFYGCYDWHSSVHGHWMLVHILRTFPNIKSAKDIEDKLNISLTTENIAAEIDYFENESKSWERMYGWAWLMKLGEELYTWEDPRAKTWYENLKPLIEHVITRYQEFLPVQKYPVRTGVHPNTAFGMTFAYDYAVATDRDELIWLIKKAAYRYYLDDESCPAHWEPSGEDFLSACLEEANLMRKVLDERSFNKWFEDFLDKKALKSLMNPVDVSDRSDPKIVHLDGLNLSRATCLYGIASVVDSDKTKEMMISGANKHLAITLPNVVTVHYEGSHWLGTFAIYALSARK